MKILRIVLNGEENPNFTITKAFEKAFSVVDTIWWQQEPSINYLNRKVLEMVRNNRYDAVFMQLQSDQVLYRETVQEISKYCPVFNWTGDVREDLSAYTYIGRWVTTLFTNVTDVNKMIAMGFRADYLQVGYDYYWYYNKGLERANQIVFCANYYPNSNFPLTTDRVEMINKMKFYFGDSFKLFGKNWDKAGIKSDGFLSNTEEAMLYNISTAAINLSHFNYSRYYSDRLLREMACGTLVLSHNYKQHELDFEHGKHFLVWNNLNELINISNQIINRNEIHADIAKNGQDLVSQKCTWDARVSEFKLLINKYQYR